MASKKSNAFLCFSLLLFASAAAAIPCKPKVGPPKFPPKEPPVNPFCPRDTLKLGACADLLGGMVSVVVGEPLGSECCAVLDGLTSAEAAACLCTVVKETALGITTKWSVALSLLLSTCKKDVPDGFKCF